MHAAIIIKGMGLGDMEPANALDYIIRKLGWVRVSDQMFELYDWNAKKQCVIDWMAKNMTYYGDQPTVEIDDRRRNNSFMVETETLLGKNQEEEGFSAYAATVAWLRKTFKFRR